MHLWQRNSPSTWLSTFSKFYGLELKDFAIALTIVQLWSIWKCGKGWNVRSFPRNAAFIRWRGVNEGPSRTQSVGGDFHWPAQKRALPVAKFWTEHVRPKSWFNFFSWFRNIFTQKYIFIEIYLNIFLHSIWTLLIWNLKEFSIYFKSLCKKFLVEKFEFYSLCKWAKLVSGSLSWYPKIFFHLDAKKPKYSWSDWIFKPGTFYSLFYYFLLWWLPIIVFGKAIVIDWK